MCEKSEAWHTIEGKHFGRCMWQQRSPNRRGLMEGLLHLATGRIMIVEKMYDDPLPSQNSSKPWPDLIGVNVYAPVDPNNMTWDGLDAALADYK
ncbi:MAG TPA: hypothetical protein VK577_04710 [Bradyrhizobium sp.]|nr:hypothetical protein [Bradyrhizobium sp.]